MQCGISFLTHQEILSSFLNLPALFRRGHSQVTCLGIFTCDKLL